ncbi:hypothetical protein MAR_024196 [Mya arenaria]|uniref:C2H2-type domain-containing protein n=1 Tax=Mya arenaria TaxID=6604 RepID=A0ABY7DUP8_MYAAR|nr:hypothetical protein MAR_024165 [Mya arenaria]WAQ99823.1 hypothetical protein MAR_024196 [Mya arenaria]
MLSKIQTDMSAVSRVQYRCRRCDKVGCRYQVVAHILKAHVPINESAFLLYQVFLSMPGQRHLVEPYGTLEGTHQ